MVCLSYNSGRLGIERHLTFECHTVLPLLLYGVGIYVDLSTRQH